MASLRLAIKASLEQSQAVAASAASPEPDLSRRLDLAAVARGAGEPETWPEPFAYSGDQAPGLVEVAPGHFVRCAA